MKASDRVYKYLRDEMHQGVILPGNAIDLNKVSDTLKISSTPLRDALIRLEAEGFVTIHPRSKVVVNVLELEDFDYLYAVMGALEYTLILNGLDNYTPKVIEKLRQLNNKMRHAVNEQDLRNYDESHFIFHEVFLEQEPNIFAERILKSVKNRLWDFPRKNFLTNWYQQAIDEHANIIDAIERKDRDGLFHFIRGVHWGFSYNKEHIIKEYNLRENRI